MPLTTATVSEDGAAAAGPDAFGFGAADGFAAGAVPPLPSKGTSSRSIRQICRADLSAGTRCARLRGSWTVGSVVMVMRLAGTSFSSMARPKSSFTDPSPSDTSRAFVPASARSMILPVSVNAFCSLSWRSIAFMYMCWALARPWSLKKACRVRSHWRACSPLTYVSPASSFSPEPPGTCGVGRSHTFCLTHTGTPPTASAIRTTPAKSTIIQWSM